jgi:hypothetical protein
MNGLHWLFCICFCLMSSGYAQGEPIKNSVETSKLNTTDEEPVVTRLEIERASGSEVCPDADAVIGAITRLFPDRRIRRAIDAESSRVSALVMIRPTLAGHEAQITVISPRAGERALIENDVNCRGLAEALAVTLVMLIEPQEAANDVNPTPLVTESASAPSSVIEQERPLPPVTIEKPTKNSPAAVVSRQLPLLASERQPRHQDDFYAFFTAAGVGGIGLLSQPALGGLMSVDFYHRSGWGVRLSGVRLWAMPANELGGTVNLTLWGTLSGPCYFKQLTTASRLDTCLLVGLGSQYANVDGFTNRDSTSVPWAVLGPQLRYLAPIVKTVGGVISIGAIGQLRQQSFSVTKANQPTERQTVAGAPRLGLIVELGLSFGGTAF